MIDIVFVCLHFRFSKTTAEAADKKEKTLLSTSYAGKFLHILQTDQSPWMAVHCPEEQFQCETCILGHRCVLVNGNSCPLPLQQHHGLP